MDARFLADCVDAEATEEKILEHFKLNRDSEDDEVLTLEEEWDLLGYDMRMLMIAYTGSHGAHCLNQFADLDDFKYHLEKRITYFIYKDCYTRGDAAREYFYEVEGYTRENTPDILLDFFDFDSYGDDLRHKDVTFAYLPRYGTSGTYYIFED